MRITALLTLILLVGLPACGGEADAPGTASPVAEHEHATPGTRADAATPRIEAGVQVVEIEATLIGFQPRAVQLEGGVPARLVFTRRTEDECVQHVRFPAFDVEKTALPLGEPVAIEFTPSEDGTFTFVCGMDMQKGTVVVEA